MTDSRRHPLLLSLGLLLGLMLAASLSYMASHPSLVVLPPDNVQTAATPQNGPTPSPGSAGMDANAAAALAPVMAKLQANPKDVDALLALASHFVHLEQWPTAETYALRAVMAEPRNPRPLHLLGIIQHGQGRYAEAAQSLSQVLTLADDPGARYSLAILNIHYLNKPEEGAALLRALIQNPKAAPELRTDAQEALKALGQQP